MAFLAIIAITAGFLLGTLIGRLQKDPASVKVDPPAFLVVSVSLGFFGLIAMLYIWPISGDSKDIIQVMLGVVGAKFGDIVAYFFNSSAGSARKTEMLSQPTTSTTTRTPTAETTTVTQPKSTKEGE